jgi:VanZ family protein
MTWLARVPRALWALAFVSACGLMLLLLLMPITIKTQTFEHLDKLEHAGAFAALMVLGSLAWPRHLFRVAVGLLIYGGLTEVLQGTLTSTRSASAADWVADALGVGVGYLLFSRLFSRRKAS